MSLITCSRTIVASADDSVLLTIIDKDTSEETSVIFPPDIARTIAKELVRASKQAAKFKPLDRGVA